MNTQLLETYTLRSKDVPLCEFALYATQEEVLGVVDYVYKIKITKIYSDNAYLFPKSLPLETLNEQNLLRWLERRKAPKNRQFVEKILAAIEDSSNPLKYVDVSYALSLNDTYWVSKSSLQIAWKDINLYSHPFDEALSLVAFTGYSHKISGVRTSPELTSSGALKKCWSNRTDGIYLLKGDSFFPRSDGRSQATNEFYAAQVADAMELEHIKYNLELFKHRDGKEEVICTCKLFTSETEGYVEAATYFKDCGIDVNDADLTSLKIQEKFLKLIGPAYADIMIFDSIIANQDRHLGNFGMLVNNDTGKYLRPAPLFDNGYSLLYGLSMQELNNDIQLLAEGLSCRYFSLDKQAKLFVEKRHLSVLRKLLGFEFTKHPQYNISDETLKVMEKFIRFRTKRAIELFHEKQNKKSV